MLDKLNFKVTVVGHEFVTHSPSQGHHHLCIYLTYKLTIILTFILLYCVILINRHKASHLNAKGVFDQNRCVWSKDMPFFISFKIIKIIDNIRSAIIHQHHSSLAMFTIDETCWKTGQHITTLKSTLFSISSKYIRILYKKPLKVCYN